MIPQHFSLLNLKELSNELPCLLYITVSKTNMKVFFWHELVSMVKQIIHHPADNDTDGYGGTELGFSLYATPLCVVMVQMTLLIQWLEVNAAQEKICLRDSHLCIECPLDHARFRHEHCSSPMFSIPASHHTQVEPKGHNGYSLFSREWTVSNTHLS